MEERRFFITEIPKFTLTWRIALESITLSELRQRLAKLSGLPLEWIEDQEIKILVNGCKEKN